MSPEADCRTELATWMTSGDNSYFSRAIVNRVWSHLLGRGLVEPVDDLRITDPATHPALLDWLTQDFMDREFQLRHVIRRICQSDVYARGTAKGSGHHATVEFYTSTIRKPMSPEVFMDVSSTRFAAVAQDFVWNLLNSNEFCTNHSTTSGPLRCVR